MLELSEKIRKEWAAGDAKRDAGLKTPEDIVRYDDISYGPDPKWNLLDVYRPAEKKGKLPVIVNVHGGGWVYGDKELYQFYGMTLAQRGFAVVNFSYRLAPETKFPAPVEDTNLVINWIIQNQDSYGLDPENLFMVGDSAGAQILVQYSCICTDPVYAEYFAFQVPEGFVPKAVALNCGAYDPLGEVLKTKEKSNPLMEDYLPEKGSEKERFLMNILGHVTGAFPPAYVMTAVGDHCREQAPLMEKVLKEHNVPYKLCVYGSKKEPLYHVFHVTIQEKMGQQCNDDECNFFREYISKS